MNVTATAVRWFLPVGLLSALIIGISWPSPGAALSNTPVQTIAVVLIFLLTGLELNTEEIHAIKSVQKPAFLGVISILLITPFVGFLLAVLPLQPPEFILGLEIFVCMPTTISAGFILSKQCHAHVGLSLFLTVFTNILGIFTIPFMLPLVISAEASGLGGLDIDPIQVLVKLCFLVLIPMLFGKLLLRPIKIVREFSKKHRNSFKTFGSSCLIMIPLMKVSTSVEDFKKVTFVQLLWLCLVGVAIHLLFLAWNAGLSYMFQFSAPVKKTFVLMTSQKTLTVAFTTLETISESSSAPLGLASVPIILTHLLMILIDALLVAYWNRDVAHAMLAQEDGDILRSSSYCDDNARGDPHYLQHEIQGARRSIEG